MNTEPLTHRMSRRQFVALAAGLSMGLLAACSDGEVEQPDVQRTPDTTSDRSPTAALPAATPTPEPFATPTEAVEPSVVPAFGTPTPMPTVVPTTVLQPTPVDPSALRAGWRRIDPSGPRPPARRDHSLVADAEGGRVYLFGGHGAGIDLGDLWMIDVDGQEWSEVVTDGERPTPRFGHSAVFDSVRRRVVVFGGQSGPTFFNDTWAFDVAAHEWRRIEAGDPIPAPRYGSGDAYDPVSNRLFLTHGFTFQGRFDDTWVLNLQDSQWSDVSAGVGGRPLPRCLLRSAFDSDRDRVLLFGGQADTASFLGDFWSLDLEAGEWSELPGGPSPRHLYSMAMRTDVAQLLVFAGRVPEGHTQDLWLFDLEQNRWVLVPVDGDSPQGRDGHDAVWLAGRETMLAFGGRSSGEFDDLWEMALTS